VEMTMAAPTSIGPRVSIVLNPNPVKASDSMNIYVGNVSRTATEHDLKDAFAAFGVEEK
jgi:RNA recognition motif-containing protein